MVHVVVYRQEGLLRGFNVTGHADYDVYGSDIVCAGISAVAQTILIGLVEHAQVKASFVIEPGNLQCLLEAEQADNPGVQLLLKTLATGVEEMEKEYGDYIQLRYQEGGPADDSQV
ncbi:MAG: ribosomal-processing cysteine protease Prp [Limnochordia bacterium]|jgi:uncharacterized protein YsxB (DUF464 family)